MKTRVMIDLETLGTSPRAAVVAIGACTFGHLWPERRTFYAAIDPDSALRIGGEVTGSTIAWWTRQERAAVESTFPETGAEDVMTALQRFSLWLGALGTLDEVWGNGASFDVVVLEEAFRMAQLPVPWTHRAHRCYRTLRSLSSIPKIEPELAHNALSDAIAQARHAEKILRSPKEEW